MKKTAFQDGADVITLRKSMGLSQPEFASVLHLELGTLRGWEQGRRRPAGPAVSLLLLVSENRESIQQKARIERRKLRRAKRIVSVSIVSKEDSGKGDNNLCGVEGMNEVFRLSKQGWAFKQQGPNKEAVVDHPRSVIKILKRR